MSKQKHNASTTREPVSAANALKMLKAGNKAFLKNDSFCYPPESERKAFADEQWPYAIVLNCADSRVSPEIMFQESLNRLFVIRVAGNIANTESIASIEYAVEHLDTKLIVVVGHEGCGAVKAALACDETPTDLGYNLNTLVSQITPAVAGTADITGKSKAKQQERLEKTVKLNAELAAKQLKERSPIIAGHRDVKIVWAYYHLVSGEVEFSKYV